MNTLGRVGVRPNDSQTTVEQKLPRSSTFLSTNSSSQTVKRQFPVHVDHSLANSDLYINRELSWINFNHRVLNEAQDKRTPLLERVKFLAIVSANIDEFYMKRLGGLKNQVSAGVKQVTIDGRTPEEQFELCKKKLLSLQRKKESIYLDVVTALRKHDIEFVDIFQLEKSETLRLRTYYIDNVLPLMTPLAIDRSHPFPFISNLSLNVLVVLKRPAIPGVLQARVKIPIGGDVPRFIRVGSEHRFVRLEELVIHNIDLLFPQTEIISCDIFRITRNAITENNRVGAEDMMEMIEGELQDRKFAPVVRLQTNTTMRYALRRRLSVELGLDEDRDVFENDVMVRMSDLMEIASLDMPSLRDARYEPIDNVVLNSQQSIFKTIRTAGSILLQHPYESFVTSVERFVYESSSDPHVAAIKMTLYRTSSDTNIIQYLIDAAHNGKHVAVVVELQARFDEAANIGWATRMEQAGIHVNYGVADLKTHCKTVLVVRRESDGLRRYAHIGTGNYHAGTAQLYSDIGLLTCNTDLTSDLSELFNYLTTGCHPLRNYRCILVAPLAMKKALISKIDREIRLHTTRSPGLIRLKTNALEDPDITAALYRASSAGVSVELIVRDICRLRPGMDRYSENISVVSIVGRFLEHSRIYYFRNNGDEEYYVGSADLMARNLERRVELLVPVEDPDARRSLEIMLLQQLNDTRCGWEMTSDGSYHQLTKHGSERSKDSQTMAMENARRRLSDASRIHSQGSLSGF